MKVPKDNVFKVVDKIPALPIVKDRLTPNLPQLPITNASQLANSVSPELLVKTIGIPLLTAELYKGRIPFNVPDESPILRKNSLGKAIFSDLQFTSINGTEHIPVDCVLYQVSQAKNIIRTPIAGRDGQIREYVGEDDFEINIRGAIYGTNGAYPWEKVINLVYFLRYNQSLGIVSKYLNEVFDITEVVVKDYTFEQSEGSYSYQKFEINCWSEKPVEILIQEANNTLPNIVNTNTTLV